MKKGMGRHTLGIAAILMLLVACPPGGDDTSNADCIMTDLPANHIMGNCRDLIDFVQGRGVIDGRGEAYPGWEGATSNLYEWEIPQIYASPMEGDRMCVAARQGETLSIVDKVTSTQVTYTPLNKSKKCADWVKAFHEHSRAHECKHAADYREIDAGREPLTLPNDIVSCASTQAEAKDALRSGLEVTFLAQEFAARNALIRESNDTFHRSQSGMYVPEDCSPCDVPDWAPNINVRETFNINSDEYLSDAHVTRIVTVATGSTSLHIYGDGTCDYNKDYSSREELWILNGGDTPGWLRVRVTTLDTHAGGANTANVDVPWDSSDHYNLSVVCHGIPYSSLGRIEYDFPPSTEVSSSEGAQDVDIANFDFFDNMDVLGGIAPMDSTVLLGSRSRLQSGVEIATDWRISRDGN